MTVDIVPIFVPLFIFLRLVELFLGLFGLEVHLVWDLPVCPDGMIC